jgi:hypothetical protein
VEAAESRKEAKDPGPPLWEKSSFAHHLIAARVLRGWQQDKLWEEYGTEGERRGRQEGVAGYMIGRWEATRTDPILTPHQWQALEAVLGVTQEWFGKSPDEILGGTQRVLPGEEDDPASSEGRAESAES